MTNHWIDIKNSDCILIMGSNAAENHPISFKFVTEAQSRGTKLINVDPPLHTDLVQSGYLCSLFDPEQTSPF